ncbi:hypothetical protein DNTS_025784, partial [Danionella cerebrum]
MGSALNSQQAVSAAKNSRNGAVVALDGSPAGERKFVAKVTASGREGIVHLLHLQCIQLFCRSQISSGSGSPEAPSEGSGRHVSQMFSRGERSPSLALEVCTGLNWSRSSQTTASAKHQPESLHPLHLAGELELHSYKPLVFLQLVFHIDSIR